MKALRCAFPLFVLLLAGCASIDSGVPGVSKQDVRDAFEMGRVLPGMTPRQVRFVWDDPPQREATATGEKWIYPPDIEARGRDYRPMVTVFFVQGRVDHVLNGDLKRRRQQPGFRDDLTHRAPRSGFDSGWSSGLQTGAPSVPGNNPALQGL